MNPFAIRQALFPLLTGVVLLFSACKRDDDPLESLIITPENNILLEPGDTLQLESNLPVDWSASSGTITAEGLFIAPAFQDKATVIATSKNDAQLQSERIIVVSNHAELFKAMRNGGYVLYFRHANATVGVDNFNSTIPQWWTLCDSTIARQLSAMGRTQAQETGFAFRNIDFPISRVISSEFCRCVETAELFDIEPVLPVETSPAITFTVYGDENGRYQRTIDFINDLPAGNGVITLTAHSFPTGSPGPLLQMGDAAVYKQQTGGGAELVAIITVADWVALK